MKILQGIEQNTQAWLDARKGKISGSKLKGLITKRGTGKKIGFYELMSERLGIEEAYEDPMERGHRLEDEAIVAFVNRTSKTVTKVGLCVSDLNENIILSPDGLIEVDGKYREAIEIKCLSSARHLEAYFTQEVPADYMEQVLQYFVVNNDLEKLHLAFYDPRITSKPFFALEVKREGLEQEIKQCLEYQLATIAEIESLLTSLAF